MGNSPAKLIALVVFALLASKCYLDNREVDVEGTYAGAKEPDPPKVSVNSVGRIHILGPGSLDIKGGTCFLLEHRLGTILVGAYHVLSHVQDESTLTLVSKKPELATARPEPLHVPYQDTSDYGSQAIECEARGDLAAFPVKEMHKKAKVLEPSRTPCKVGEPVWILELRGPANAPTGAEALPCEVSKHSNLVLVLRMKAASNVKWTSGAPVINQHGKVVGINVGFFQDQTGYYRIAVPTSSLQALLE